MYTPEQAATMYPDEFLDPMKAVKQLPLARKYAEFYKEVFDIVAEFSAVIQLARDDTTKIVTKNTYLEKYETKLKILRAEILEWAT
jgi:hypothetical protein